MIVGRTSLTPPRLPRDLLTRPSEAGLCLVHPSLSGEDIEGELVELLLQRTLELPRFLVRGDDVLFIRHIESLPRPGTQHIF